MHISVIKNSFKYTKWFNSWLTSMEGATLYHQMACSKIIKESYNHDAFIIVVTRNDFSHSCLTKDNIIGCLPVIHMNYPVFGRKLVSMPFFDTGGIIAENESVEKRLFEGCIWPASKLRTTSIELRQLLPINWLDTYLEERIKGVSGDKKNISYFLNTEKNRMVKDLPDTSEQLMTSFKSKLRSQINKGMKEGLSCRIGWLELFDDFYDVFLKNMRDLGSPIHSKNFIENSILNFRRQARIFVVYHKTKPIAASIVIGYKDILSNPWASSLRYYSKMSPNMLLYWKMLEYACNKRYKKFDFGRSTVGEGTYKFKEQWGAMPEQLYWYTIHLDGHQEQNDYMKNHKHKDMLIACWRRIPVSTTAFVGPILRRHISL